MEVPICEECNIEMHKFGYTDHDNRLISGWACMGCGWSDDDEEYDNHHQQLPINQRTERELLYDRWLECKTNIQDIAWFVQDMDMTYTPKDLLNFLDTCLVLTNTIDELKLKTFTNMTKDIR